MICPDFERMFCFIVYELLHSLLHSVNIDKALLRMVRKSNKYRRLFTNELQNNVQTAAKFMEGETYFSIPTITNITSAEIGIVSRTYAKHIIKTFLPERIDFDVKDEMFSTEMCLPIY